jgi:hypothetical protein
MNTRKHRSRLNRKYGSRLNFWSQVTLAILAIMLTIFLCATGKAVIGLVFLAIVSCAMARPQARCCAVTLTVPEIMADVLDAFKLETPEVFGPNGFATDFSSATAVLGDTITAKIDKLPVTGAYDRNNGGFKNAAQDVTTLIEDVPVVLDQFRIVTVNVNWLTQLASKIQLYQFSVKNHGYALSKYVLDTILGKLVLANFSNRIQVPLANVNLDTIDLTVRDQMNTQKMSDTGRFMICNTPFASKFGGDDRVRSGDYFYQQNGERGYRRWIGIGGLNWVREYPDFPNNGIDLQAYAGEKRGVVVAARAMNFSNVADQLGIPKVMDFYPPRRRDQRLAHDRSGVARRRNWRRFCVLRHSLRHRCR